MADCDKADGQAKRLSSQVADVGRGDGRSKRGGRGGGGRPMPRERQISHALSKLLRHDAVKAGIALDAEGYGDLALVLAWGPLGKLEVTVGEVRDVIATNDKQRFAWKLKPGLDAALLATSTDAADFVIRANQGHSIPLASDGGLLQPIDDADKAPPVVCHGTYVAFWAAIEAAGGLRRMTRNHVHMGCLDDATHFGATDTPIPGLRKDAELLVYVDVRRALRESPDLTWWRAANGVVLSEGIEGVVPARFFQRVVVSAHGMRLFTGTAADALKNAAGEIVLWDGGHKVADIPAEVQKRARIPQGKAGKAGKGKDQSGTR